MWQTLELGWEGQICSWRLGYLLPTTWVQHCVFKAIWPILDPINITESCLCVYLTEQVFWDEPWLYIPSQLSNKVYLRLETNIGGVVRHTIEFSWDITLLLSSAWYTFHRLWNEFDPQHHLTFFVPVSGHNSFHALRSNNVCLCYKLSGSWLRVSSYIIAFS